MELNERRIKAIEKLFKVFPCNRCISYVGDECPNPCTGLNVEQLNSFFHKVKYRVTAQNWELDAWGEE